MATYRLQSDIAPKGPHEFQVFALASRVGSRDVEMRLETAASLTQAEFQRECLLVTLETYLRDRGHDILDAVEE